MTKLMKETDMATFQINSLFIAEIGKCYEVHFGKITLNGQEGYCTARIRVLGNSYAHWEDMDTNLPLDNCIAVHAVQGYREIQCL